MMAVFFTVTGSISVPCSTRIFVKRLQEGGHCNAVQLLAAGYHTLKPKFDIS